MEHRLPARRHLLVTEREGRLRIIRNGTLDAQPVAGTPASHVAGTSGLPGAVHGYMDVVLHPQFATNRFVYLQLHQAADEQRAGAAVARGTWDGRAIDQACATWWCSNQASAPRCVIAFGRDNMLYVTTAGGMAQDGTNQGGKVLRYTDDGDDSAGQPVSCGKAGYRPESLHARPSQLARAGDASRAPARCG